LRLLHTIIDGARRFDGINGTLASTNDFAYNCSSKVIGAVMLVHSSLGVVSTTGAHRGTTNVIGTAVKWAGPVALGASAIIETSLFLYEVKVANEQQMFVETGCDSYKDLYIQAVLNGNAEDPDVLADVLNTLRSGTP
jgi:hypothetical protein